MTGVDGKIVLLRLYMESSDHVYNYTGKVSKAILLTEVPELEHFFKPVKGFFKQLRVSPPISNGKAIIPMYTFKKIEGNYERLGYELRPVLFRGNYVVEASAPSSIVDTVYARLRQAMNVRTRLKFENTIITYLIEDVSVEEPRVRIRDRSYVLIKTLSPALLTNPLVASQQVRRFTTSPGVLLWVPRMISDGVITSLGDEARRRYLELEECLAEHYSTRHKIVFVNYDNNREPALTTRAKYILTPKDDEARTRCIELLEKTLTAARIYGIGASRANGFGTIEIETQRGST